MKRKKGHKKGNKSKKSKLNESTNQTTEHSSPPKEYEKNEVESKAEVANKSVGRVKVKLKTSKPSEKPDVVVDKKEVDKPVVIVEEKKEELVVVPRKPVVLNVYRKTKGIKIKSSRLVEGSSSSVVVEKSVDPPVKALDVVIVPKKDVKPPVVVEDSKVNKKETESVPIVSPKEEEKKKKKSDQSSSYNKGEEMKKKSDRISSYNKREIEESLVVIKKIMKMDASDPFNVPVNPEALGIPDYFDIIKTPMDFGTICDNLEKGNKYMNSEDVFKDVQYIWNNCSQYNKKGDYIVDLMKRVKKNFMKYWTAAGLYTESTAENGQVEDGEKASSKGSQSKQKIQKRHGRQHKSDCMCAVCILMRRKRERERGSQGRSGPQEESSLVRSPSIDNSSINIGEEEQDMDVDVVNKTRKGKSEVVELDSPVSEKQKPTENKQLVEEEEDEEEENAEMEIENKIETNVDDKTQYVDVLMEEAGDEPVTMTSTVEIPVVLDTAQGSKPPRNEEEDKEKRLREQKERKELERKEWRVKIHEKFQVMNPKLLSLCGTLFPSNNSHKSVWNGPHSLFKRRGGSNCTSSMQKALMEL